MTKYNTGNPVGSNSPLDLFDNAQNLDDGINGEARTWVDRTGQTRKSWSGIETDFQEFLADGSVITFSTWAEAEAAAGDGHIPTNRQVQVIGDEGTHTDPVSGLVVSNSGRFIMGESGLEWRSDDALAAKADQVELVATQDQLSESYAVAVGKKIPIAGTTDAVGAVRANVLYDVDTDEMQINGDSALTTRSGTTLVNANLSDSIGGDSYSAPASPVIPLACTIDAAGNVRMNVGYDVNRMALLVNGEGIGGTPRRWASADPVEAPAVTDIMHIFTYGQSLSNGVNSIPVSSVGQRYNNLTFAQGPRSTKAGSVGQLPGMDALVPLTENTLTGDGVSSPQHGETPCSGWANALTRRLALDGIDWRAAGPRWLASANGKGSASINNLLPGGTSDLGEWFQVLRDAVEQGHLLADAGGNTYSVPCWLYMQGEGDNADAAMAGGAYKAKLQQLHEAVTAKVGDVTGSAATPWLGIYQTYARTLRERPHATLDQIAYCEQAAGVFHLTALYHLPLASDGHLTTVGSYWVGEYAAKKTKQILDGRRPTWMRLGAATISGRVVRYKPREVPVAPLQLVVDQHLRATTNFGFLVRDANGSCPIETIGISPYGDEVVITLSSVPTGAVQLRYGLDYLPAGQVSYAASAGGNLVDSDPETFVLGGNEYPLYNVCPHFQCDVIPV